MSKATELEIKNKYTGEVIRTILADTQDSLQAKIKKASKNQHKLAEMDFFERAKILAKFATKLRFAKKKLKPLIVQKEACLLNTPNGK